MSITRPLVRPLTSPLSRAIGGAGGGGGVLSAFSSAKLAIQQDAGDVNILVIGDSTGNATDEWVYLFGQWLATQHPTHSVSYRLWADASMGYSAPVVLGSGSGAHTIRIWNNSVPGRNAQYIMGDKFASIVGVATHNLVIWNHGHNHVTQGVPALVRGLIVSAMEMVRQAQPTAAHAMFNQNPLRDSSAYAFVDTVIRGICADRGDTLLLDSYSGFAGKAADLYADNVHPSSLGQQIYLNQIKGKWSASLSSQFTTLAAWLDSTATNYITNGDFSDWPAAVPAGWTVQGAGTAATKDATIVDGTSPYALRLDSTAAFSSVNGSLVSGGLLALRGQVVTFAVRQRVEVGQAGSVGRISLNYTGGTTTSSAQVDGQGGWRWMILSGVQIPPDSIFVTPVLYADIAASAGSVVRYDRAVLVIGNIPRDMA